MQLQPTSEPELNPDPMVRIEGLGLHFKQTDKTAFRDIRLNLSRGEIVAIIGPSGCGKSTLLKTIAGLIQASEGGVSWHKNAKPELAFIFQDPTLLPWLTAFRNVEVPLRLRGATGSERKSRCEKAMQEVLLSDYAHYYPKALSGGMKMRISLARALSLDPELLFLDEPFGALDAMTRNQMNQLVLELQRELGWSALMVTHSVNEAVYMADRVCVMTASPGTFLETIEIHLPRHRTMALQSTPDYLHYVAHIRDLIGKEMTNEAAS